MFYDGDLQSGISHAIQEQKLVACFIRQDNDDESERWENEWLRKSVDVQDTQAGATLGTKLAEKAVLLRIQAGSQEAGFLSAFCSLDNIPKLVIISNGSVLEDIERGVSEDEFSSRISAQIGLGTQPGSTSDSSNKTASTTPAAAPATSQASQQPLVASTASDAANARVQTMMAARRERLEKERKEKEEAEKKERRAVAKARKEEAEKAAAASSSIPASRQSYLQEQRTRQLEAKRDRERVLKAIEADKQARRDREQQRRLAAQVDSNTGAADEAGPSSASTPSLATQTRPSGRQTNCSLQIRLFDGTSLRSRFSADATLSTSVRTYVSENSRTDIPYNFRQMLTPHPSRNIEISEENESLLSLGLCPSATLVLVPVKDFTQAYYVSGGQGIINRGINTTFHLVNGAFGLLTSVVGRVTGYGGDGASDGPYVAGTGDEVEPSNVQGNKMAEGTQQAGPSSSAKIRTLADQRREQNTNQFYNGNQINVQPRKKDDEEEKHIAK